MGQSPHAPHAGDVRARRQGLRLFVLWNTPPIQCGDRAGRHGACRTDQSRRAGMGRGAHACPAFDAHPDAAPLFRPRSPDPSPGFAYRCAQQCLVALALRRRMDQRRRTPRTPTACLPTHRRGLRRLRRPTPLALSHARDKICLAPRLSALTIPAQSRPGCLRNFAPRSLCLLTAPRSRPVPTLFFGKKGQGQRAWTREAFSLLFDLSPGIFERNRAVEHGFARGAVWIGAEVSDTGKLETLAGLDFC